MLYLYRTNQREENGNGRWERGKREKKKIKNQLELMHVCRRQWKGRVQSPLCGYLLSYGRPWVDVPT